MQQNKKSIIILGATGTIGDAVLEVIMAHRDRFHIIGLVANNNSEKILSISDKLAAGQEKPPVCVLAGLEKAQSPIKTGKNAIDDLLAQKADLVIGGISGLAGMESMWQAIAYGSDLAIANKEPMVTAGKMILAHAKQHNSQILPLDSEHNALFQILKGHGYAGLQDVTITASGGPFFKEPKDLSKITPQQAIKHPIWKMGKKISVDSATLMNKGLEIIEAMHLFNLAASKVKVLVHPQALVHAMAHYHDGTIINHMAPSHMRHPVSSCLMWPERLAAPNHEKLLMSTTTKETRLDFFPVDLERFPAITLAYQVANADQSTQIAFNAANEVAVACFLANQIKFTDIVPLVQKLLDQHKPLPITTIEEVYTQDRISRNQVNSLLVS